MPGDEPRGKHSSAKPLHAGVAAGYPELAPGGLHGRSCRRESGIVCRLHGKPDVFLDRGEERLITAVEAGTIPIAVAMHIARTDDTEVQSALVDAYEEGTLKGRQLAVVRKLLERRSRSGGKSLPAFKGPSAPRPRELAPEQLRRLYMRESDRQRVLAKKVEVTHARLLFIVHALRQLLLEDGFIALLEQEGLTTLPRILDQRIRAEVQSWPG